MNKRAKERERDAVRCDVCAVETTRPVDPTPLVPELAPSLHDVPLCSWACARTFCLAMVHLGRADQIELIKARFAAYEYRIDS